MAVYPTTVLYVLNISEMEDETPAERNRSERVGEVTHKQQKCVWGIRDRMEKQVHTCTSNQNPQGTATQNSVKLKKATIMKMNKTDH